MNATDQRLNIAGATIGMLLSVLTCQIERHSTMYIILYVLTFVSLFGMFHKKRYVAMKPEVSETVLTAIKKVEYDLESFVSVSLFATARFGTIND